MSSNKLLTVVWKITSLLDASTVSTLAYLNATIVAGFCSVFRYATFALLYAKPAVIL